MPTSAELARAAAVELTAQTGVENYEMAITLGSGWRGAVGHLGEIVCEIPAEEIPGFRQSGVAGHSGLLRTVRTADDKYILVIGARTHLYEGFGVEAVVHGVRTAAAAGVHTMVLTNGAGCLNPSWSPGQPVLISDHINLTARSPIQGANFVDLTDLYSKRLRQIAHEIEPDLSEGVYAQMSGPDYETPAEVRMLRTLGADLVGMSTALEAIAAREAGLEVLAISLITNLAAGTQDTPLKHAEVLDAGKAAENTLGPLLARIADNISREDL